MIENELYRIMDKKKLVTAVGLGLQLASYINMKNDRSSSKL